MAASKGMAVGGKKALHKPKIFGYENVNYQGRKSAIENRKLIADASTAQNIYKELSPPTRGLMSWVGDKDLLHDADHNLDDDFDGISLDELDDATEEQLREYVEHLDHVLDDYEPVDEPDMPDGESAPQEEEDQPKNKYFPQFNNTIENSKRDEYDKVKNPDRDEEETEDPDELQAVEEHIQMGSDFRKIASMYTTYRMIARMNGARTTAEERKDFFEELSKSIIGKMGLKFSPNDGGADISTRRREQDHKSRHRRFKKRDFVMMALTKRAADMDRADAEERQRREELREQNAETYNPESYKAAVQAFDDMKGHMRRGLINLHSRKHKARTRDIIEAYKDAQYWYDTKGQYIDKTRQW